MGDTLKLNNKGFAISSVMYIILVLAVVLIALTLALFSSRKLILDKLRNSVVNAVNNTHSYTYRQTLNKLKEEAITYATKNNITKDSIKISNLDSVIDDEIINDYKLSNKYLTMVSNNNTYDVYLGESKTITDVSKNTDSFIDIVDYKISGNSYQQTYTGKNLIDYETAYNTGNFTIEDGIVSGEAVKFLDVNFDLSEYVGEEVTASVLSKVSSETLRSEIRVIRNGGSGYVYLDSEMRGTSTTDFQRLELTFTVNEGDQLQIAYGTGGGEIIYIKDFQLEIGNKVTTYEPYVGGIPAPNPDYPQEIESVGQYDETIGKYKIPIKVSGKNKINNSFRKGDLNNSHDTIRLYITQNLKLKPNQTYTVSTNLPSSYNYAVHVLTTTHPTPWTNVISDSGWLKELSYTFETQSECYFGIQVKKADGSTLTVEEIEPYWFQLEEGAISTDYEPYIEPVTTNIYLDEPLRKVGEYFDYIDFENKNVIKNIKEYTLNGLEPITAYSTNTEGKYRLFTNVPDGIGVPTDDLGVMSTHYIGRSAGAVWNLNQGISNHAIPSFVVIYDENYQTTDSLKNMFREKYLNNAPIKVIYPREKLESLIELPHINVNNGASIIEIGTDIAPSSVEFTVIEKIKQL